MERKPLHWVDWMVFAASLVISIAIGIYFACTGGKQKTTKEYLVANRQLSVIPAALSMFMSLISAIFILGQTSEVYFHGTQIMTGQIGSVLGYIIAAILFVPLFYRLKLISSYEYLAKRYGTDADGKILKLTCVILAILQGVLYMGMAMFAPSTAMEAVTGFPLWATVVLTGVVATFYTTIGGMKTVVWTDTFQGLVLFAGTFAILISGALKVGGLSKIWQIANENNRFNFFNFNPDPTLRLNFWTLLIGRFVYTVASVGTSQNNVQRFCALPTLNKARLSVLVVSFFEVASMTIITFSGLTIFAYFTSEGCDPLRGGHIQNKNQLLPYFIVNVLGYPGLSGLFLAVLFSGALSSLSSMLNALSAITWRDLIQNRFSKVSEARKALITKILVFCYGVIAMLVAFVVPYFPGHIMQVALRILPAFRAPVTGIMSLGFMTGFANAIGVTIGGVTSLVFTTIINIGSYITNPHQTFLPTIVDNCTLAVNTSAAPVPTDPPAGSIFPLFRLSFMLMGLVGIVITLVVGGLASIILGGEKKERRDRRYIVPLSEHCCCCCPVKLQEFLLCGITDYETEEEHGENIVPIQDSKITVFTKKPDSSAEIINPTDKYQLTRM